MILKKGKLKIKLEDFSDIVNVVITLLNGQLAPLQRVSTEQMGKLHKEMKDGLPIAYCVNDDQSITIYPRPDRDYGSTVRILPPVQEL